MHIDLLNLADRNYNADPTVEGGGGCKVLVAHIVN